MKKTLLKSVMALFLFAIAAMPLQAQIKAVYAGGPAHQVSQPISYIDELRSSGFDTVIIWTIHIEDNYALNWNFVDALVDANGNYVGGQGMVDRIARLKQSPTGVNRIEFGIGSASGGQFNKIRDHYNAYGGFPVGSPLYNAFKKLKDTFPFVDAINNDDEVTYDVASTVSFTKMLASLGFKNAIVPYRNASSYWGQVVSQVNSAYPGNVDRNYIQCYAGGGNNDPCQSQWNFGITNIGGLWGGSGQDTPQDVTNTMTGWKNTCGFNGGFMWLYDDFKNSAQSYATAISNVTASTGGGGGGSAPNISRGKPFAVSSTYSAGYEGWRANDGNGTTRWASAPSGQTQWIYYDLEADYLIESVKIDWEAAYSYDFNIQIWNGSSWVNVTGLTNNNQLTNRLGVNDVGRYVRLISWRAPNNLISTWQFEVFGTPAGGGGGNTNNNGGATNIAQGKPFAISSLYSAGYEGWRSNDGNGGTRWASAPSGTNETQWVYYDLEAYYNISSVNVKWEAAYSLDFNIQVWNGSQWVNVTGVTNNNTLVNGLGMGNTTARYVRLISWRHYVGLISVWEFEIFGTYAYAAKRANSKQTAPPEALEIAQITENKAFKVFPNPVSDNFNISLKGFKKADITISDLLGKTIYRTHTTNNELNLTKGNTFKTGMYIIKVVDENNKQHISKLVVK